MKLRIHTGGKDLHKVVKDLQQELEKERCKNQALEDKESKSSVESNEKTKEIITTLNEQLNKEKDDRKDDLQKKLTDLEGQIQILKEKENKLTADFNKENSSKMALEKVVAELEQKNQTLIEMEAKLIAEKSDLEKSVASFIGQVKLVPELLNRPTFRVFCKAETNKSVSVKDGRVVLARYNPLDVFQHWIKEERISGSVKDVEGFPSFSLVNKATGQAMNHSIGQHNLLQLSHYNPNEVDKCVLWSETNDLGDGFKGVRMLTNIHMYMDAFREPSGEHDNVGLWNWNQGNNQRWRIVPYCKSFN